MKLVEEARMSINVGGMLKLGSELRAMEKSLDRFNNCDYEAKNDECNRLQCPPLECYCERRVTGRGR